jgi:hypothetical protein
MMDKVLFWLDADLTSFCLAYYLQKKIDAEFYAIIDITNRPKKFFMNQKLIAFKKIWFYHDFMNQKIKSEQNYLKSFEEKFNIDLWQLAKNDRIFTYDYNNFYKFSEHEISEIMEKECKLFEEILDKIKPNFFITTETALRQHHLFYLICKKKGIKVLILNLANWGNYCYISENYHRIDNFEEIFKNKKSSSTTFNDLKNRLESKILSKKLTKFYQIQKKSQLEKIKAAFQLLILSDNSNEKTHYTYYGRKKLKVLFKEIQHSLKRWYREKYINKIFLQQIPNDLSFIFLPLQQEPERSLLIGAPDYVNQIKTVEYVSKCIPKNYLLFVKEHPTQGPGRGWRKISDYQAMQNNPKVKLIHPSVPANEIVAKSKLVISVSGTLALESAFFNKPSITFVDNDYTLIPSISRLKSKNELRELIEDSLEKKVEPNYVGKYFDILEENSFVFDYLGFQVSYLKHFYFDGNLADVEINESEMLKFLLEHEKSFSVLIERFKQKINDYEKN